MLRARNHEFLINGGNKYVREIEATECWEMYVIVEFLKITRHANETKRKSEMGKQGVLKSFR